MVDEIHLALLGLCPLPALGQRTQRLAAGLRSSSVHRQLLQLLLELLLLLLLLRRRLLLRGRRWRRLLGLRDRHRRVCRECAARNS